MNSMCWLGCVSAVVGAVLRPGLEVAEEVGVAVVLESQLVDYNPWAPFILILTPRSPIIMLHHAHVLSLPQMIALVDTCTTGIFRWYKT